MPSAGALDWIAAKQERLSAFNARIWSHVEPAWREYRSARDYVELLRAEGFMCGRPRRCKPLAVLRRAVVCIHVSGLLRRHPRGCWP